MAEIGCESFAYIHRQGHPIMHQALAANEDFPGAPINIVELQCNDLPSTETETGEEKKNCMVATTRCRVPITTVEHSGDFIGSEVLRDSGQAPIGNCGDGRSQVYSQFSLLKEKAKK